jgi:hypothetical protein
MNGDMAIELAEERLLSVALAELACEPRVASASVWSTWWRAAMVLLAVSVALATAWYVRADRVGVAGHGVQEPEPLPPPVRVEGREALEALLKSAPKTRNCGRSSIRMPSTWPPSSWISNACCWSHSCHPAAPSPTSPGTSCP